MDEYSLCVSNSSNLINGSLNLLEYKTKTENIDINADSLATALVLKHSWVDKTFAHFEAAGVVNVKDPVQMNGNPAQGDGSTDDIGALEYAIAHYDKVFLPKGTYLVSKTLILDENTQLFGISRPWSSVNASDTWNSVNGNSLIQPVNDPDATTSLSFLGVRSGSHPLTWKAGKNSIVRDINPRTVYINGNGGGKWFCPFNTGQHLTVDGTTQDLMLYGTNPERASDPQYEIKNAQNVQVFYAKSEAGGTVSAVATTLKISNSRNIAVHGCTGNINLSSVPGKPTMEIVDCDDIVVTYTHPFNGSAGWYVIREKIGAGPEVGVEATQKLAMYKRGNPFPRVSGQDVEQLRAPELWPNPCRDYLTIHADNLVHGSVYQVVDLQGETVMTGKLESKEMRLPVPSRSGVYILSFPDQYRVHHLKFIKL